jgi:hypothetical protein
VNVPRIGTSYSVTAAHAWADGGLKTIGISLTDGESDPVIRSVQVRVADDVKPVVSVPADIVAEATGPDGASVAIAAACSPYSPHVFALGTHEVACTASDSDGNEGWASFTVIVRDTTKPAVTYSGNAGTYTIDQTVDIRCTATDSASGVASTTCTDVIGPAYTFALGSNEFSATATDGAGNGGRGATSFTVVAPLTSLQTLVAAFSTRASVTQGLNAKLAAAARAPNANARAGQLGAFANQVRAQTGKALTAEQAAVLLRLVAH